MQKASIRQRAEAEELGILKAVSQYPLIDTSLCIGCGACVDACPEKDVLRVVWGKAQIVNGLRCVGHGHCEDACPVQAIKVGLGDIKSRPDIPILSEDGETSVSGLFIAGELGGLSLIRNAINQGREAAEAIVKARLPNPPEPNVYEAVIIGAGPAGLSAALRLKQEGMTALEDEIVNNLKQLTLSKDLDLQSLALVALHLSKGDDPATRKLLTEALDNAEEKEKGLRRRWAITMDYLASPFLSRQDYANAISVYQKAYAIDPEDSFIINNLVNSYIATENLTAAIVLLKESLSRRPYDAELHFKLSNLYNRNGQIDEAISTLKKGLELDPDNRNQRSILEYLEEKR